MKKTMNSIMRFNLTVMMGIILIALTASSVSAEVCKKKQAVGLGVGVGYYVTFDTGTPQCKSAKEALESAIVIVTGSQHYMFANDKSSASNAYVWVNDLAANPKYSAKFNEGLKFNDAVSFLKERIAANAEDRQFAIDNAFLEVYGRVSNANEQASWDAKIKTQKAWYAVIVTSEIGNLNSKPMFRTAMIDDVYIKTMGRTATPDELNYWKSRTEHFRLMVAANRAFLYSGAKKANEDLLNAIKVAYLAKYKKDPSDMEKKTALTLIADKKLVFDEMMKPEISLKK